jgi:hypothetical protein
MAMLNKLIPVATFSRRLFVLILNSSWASSTYKGVRNPEFQEIGRIKAALLSDVLPNGSSLGRATASAANAGKPMTFMPGCNTKAGASSLCWVRRTERRQRLERDLCVAGRCRRFESMCGRYYANVI